ncbi:hypothetical protein L5876_00530 [Hyphobacterium sp. SN044]|uniref:hypothetical protein n=1 Tax=Hyphobacterium sp. SN044 TaxID=2912575 RepID=UPI001F1C5A53|nr:hypothetical protein [Hyphobacterium sp. SN044]MCF8878298.1 hypothetical protein [Hyphobacterium sp. SN044]
MRTRLILATVASLAMISVAAYATQHDDHTPAIQEATEVAADVVSTDETVGVEAEALIVEDVVAEGEDVVTDETVVEEVVTEDVAAEPTDETVTEVAEEPAH